MTTLTRPGKILLMMSTISVLYAIIAAIPFLLVPKARYWLALPVSAMLNIFPFVVGFLWSDPSWSKTTRTYLRIVPLCLVVAYILVAAFLAILHRPLAAYDVLWRAPFWVMLYIPFLLGRYVSKRRSQH